jgi:hypothetical protein
MALQDLGGYTKMGALLIFIIGVLFFSIIVRFWADAININITQGGITETAKSGNQVHDITAYIL